MDGFGNVCEWEKEPDYIDFGDEKFWTYDTDVDGSKDYFMTLPKYYYENLSDGKAWYNMLFHISQVK